MFIMPGRVYALNPVDAIDKIQDMIAARGLKYVGPVELQDDGAVTKSVTRYEFYCKVMEYA